MTASETSKILPYEQASKLMKIYNEENFEKNNQRNSILLDLFEEDLRNAGLKETTIRRHVCSVNMFLSDMAYREGLCMEDALFDVDTYLGDWYIRRNLSSTPASIKITAASIKKFAQCMLEHNLISKETVSDLKETIALEMDGWQRRCSYYNNIDENFDFDTFYRISS